MGYTPAMPSDDSKLDSGSGGSQVEPPLQAGLDDPTQPSPEDERVEQMLGHTIDVSALASAVELQDAADAADTLEQLADDEAVELLEEMDAAAAAEALAEMQTPLAATVIADLAADDRAYAVRLLGLMAPDDAADLLQRVVPEAREPMLAGLPAEDAANLRRLVGYAPESAGGLMTTDFVGVRADMKVSQAVEALRRATVPEELQARPVLGDSGVLVGLVGLRQLLLGDPEGRIADLMLDTVPAVNVGMDREEVTLAFDRYDHSMLPVVDDEDRLLGIVTVDDVIDAIREEQTEDVQRTVGAGAGEAVFSGFGEKFRGRFPWLAASLFMTAAAAIVVLLFEDLIRENPILAFVMPVIAALVGNAGHQALAVTLRGIVLEEVRRDIVGPLVVREMLVGLLNGTLLGIAMALAIAAIGPWVNSDVIVQIGVSAGLATMAAMTIGTLAGSSVPLVMRHLGFDPAHASAIVLIMITDAVSFGVLLGLAWLIV